MINSRLLTKASQGFTLVELMIATAVFSVILLICTTAVLVIGQEFHKTAIAIATQETSKTIMEDVTREVQLSGRAPVSAPTRTVGGINQYAVCVGAVRYTYLLNYELEDIPAAIPSSNQTPHALWKDVLNDPSTCNTGPPGPAVNTIDLTQQNPYGGPSSTGRELMSIHTRLNASNGFNIINNDPSGIDTRLWNIDVNVIYGDNATITAAQNCVSSSAGGAFCGLSELHTSAYRRSR